MRAIVECGAWHITPGRNGWRVFGKSSNQGKQWGQSRYATAEDFALGAPAKPRWLWPTTGRGGDGLRED